MSRAPRTKNAHPPVTTRPPLTLWLILRLTLVMAHMVFGFLLAFLIGLFFFEARWQQPVITWWLRRLTGILNLHITVHGEPVEASALWISNHVSWMDIPVLGGIRRLNFLSKAEVARWPLIGHLARAGGTLFIQRGSGDSERVSRQMVTALAEGKRVLFFPEGTTTDGHTVKRFFAKLFASAVESQCLIQPMLICYRDGDSLHPIAPFIGDDEMGAHLLHILNGGRIHVEVKFLTPERAGLRDARDLAHHFEEVMRHALADFHGAEQPPSRAEHPAVRAA